MAQVLDDKDKRLTMNVNKAMMGSLWLLAGIICGVLAAKFPDKASIVTIIMVVIAGWFVRSQPLTGRLLTAGSLIVGFGLALLVMR